MGGICSLLFGDSLMTSSGSVTLYANITAAALQASSSNNIWTTVANWNSTGGTNYLVQTHLNGMRNRFADSQEHVKESRRRIEANDRAATLLLAHLDPIQAAQYEKDRYFEVLTTRKGKLRRYRISYGWAGNITVLDEKGRPIEKLCIHPTKAVPYADNLLAQKLLLEADEERFLKIANRTAVRTA